MRLPSIFQTYVSGVIMFRPRMTNVLGQGRMLLRGAVKTHPARLARRPAVSGIAVLNNARDRSSRLHCPLHKVDISTFVKYTLIVQILQN
jgi:hypothetical protein